MRQRWYLVLTSVLATLAVVVILGLLPREAAAERRKSDAARNDVVFVRCVTDDAQFKTTGYEGSPAAPDRRFESCPDTLTHLLKEGFAIQHIAHSDVDADYLVFMLLRE